MEEDNVEIRGCEDCGELVEESRVCPYCGGVTLDHQEAMDKILQQKSELREVISYDEGC